MKKYTMNEILNSTRLGKTDWGFVFFDDGETRQSIDLNDGMVVVEKYLDDEWRCMSSYLVTKTNSILEGKTQDEQIQFGN